MKKIVFFLFIAGMTYTAYSQSWNITGNAGTNPAVNFLGTTDKATLVLRVRNQYAGEIDSVYFKTFIGYRVGANNGTRGLYNTAMGFKSLNVNTTGAYNTALGYYSLSANMSSNGNTVNGAYSLTNTRSGLNTAMGAVALYLNTTGASNTATGISALDYNKTGSYNTANGDAALAADTTGSYNTATGDLAMNNNYTGSYNTALGNSALEDLTTGNYNVGIGESSLNNVGTAWYNVSVGANVCKYRLVGWNNTLIGANINMTVNGLYNCIAVGQDITFTVSNQARFGNLATTTIGGYANWTNLSDGRYKKDVMANVKGLDFIMKLQPVTYHLDVTGLDKKLHEGMKRETNEFTQRAMVEKERIVFSGFIAQDVEKAANEAGYDFNGVDKPQNKDGLYGLRYEEFVMPLVKAKQEQQQVIQLLMKQNALLQQRIEQLEKKQNIDR